MADRKIRVRVNRSYSTRRGDAFTVGDELIVVETSEVKAEVKAGLLDKLGVEPDPAAEKPKAEKAAKGD